MVSGRNYKTEERIAEKKQLSVRNQIRSRRRKKSENLDTFVMGAYLNGRIYMSLNVLLEICENRHSKPVV